MDLMPVGDRYIWYCDWCDTKNVTPWVRVSEKEVCCAACHKSFPSSVKAEPAMAPTGRRRLELL
ncbi:hypothetical protein E4633_11550 [Geomonas terrae]|uniref:GATA-type domain-containing protein n=1 Tax=Geomonas terrae TaxID=2562681 RepID=A0A4S1CBJ2_9BACT|nr:hypothetical protein E4633_15940 [Geomonas terrae]TGU72913.1 hypothetical protein E4633_11550 [Geomonas terrae]